MPRIERATRKPGSTAEPKPRLLTLQQASAEDGPPYTSLRDLVLRGKLPSVRIEKRIWIHRSDLERLIETSTAREAK